MLVISGAWMRKEMVWNRYSQTGRRMEQDCWELDAQLCWERTSCISRHRCFGKSRIEKQRKRKEVYSLQRKGRNRWTDSSHCYFRQSAQYQRSSHRFVQRISQRLSPKMSENWESMVVPTEFPNANAISQTDMSVQGNLLREYEQKFAQLPEDQKLTKPCSDAGFLKDIGKGQFFITLEAEGSDDMQTSCREYTLPRDQETSRARGWIRGNMKIGPVLDVKVYFHQGRYCVDIMIASLFKDQTVSWVRVVNGMNQYGSETLEEIPVESIELVRTGKLVAKAKPRPKLAVTLSLVSIPIRESMDRHQSSNIQSRLFCRVTIHDHINATWCINSSRRRWSSKILWPDWKVQGKVRWHFAMDRRRTYFTVAWILTLPNISCISDQSRDIQEVIMMIHYGKTMYCCRMTSPSTSTTSGTLSKCTPLSKVDWSQEEKASEGTGSQCSSQPWTRWMLDKIRETLNTIWTNPESHRKSILGKLITKQYVGAIWSCLRERDCNSIKQGTSVTQGTSRYTCAELATQSEGSPFYRFEKSHDCEWAKGMSTGRPVAVVVLIFESQAFHIPLLNRWKHIAKKQSDD